MPAKKTKPAKAKNSGKKKSRPKPPSKFPCPNPGKKLGMVEIIHRMQRNSAFADFISELLRNAYGGDKAAEKCLYSYYDPTSRELTDLGVTPDVTPPCTVPGQTMLLVVPARIFGSQGPYRQ